MKKSISCLLGLAMLAALSVVHANEQSRLEEVVVTSSRVAMPLRQIATSVSVIDKAELELKGYSSLTDVLRTEAAIGASNSGGQGKASALRIRGEEGYRTLVLIDGVDVSDPTATQVGPQIHHLINSDDIERIEVLRGPQGFLYGADAGGVVNIITRRGTDGLTGQLSAEAGSFGTQRLGASIANGSEQGDFYLSVTDFTTDGFNARTDDTVLNDDDGYENTTVHARGGWNINQALRIEAVLRDTEGESNFDGCGFPTSFDCESIFEQTNNRLMAVYQTETMSHQLSLGSTDVERRSVANSNTSFETEGEISLIEYIGTYDLNEDYSLVFGASNEEEDIVSSGDLALKRDQQAFFFELQASFDDRLFLTAGARNDDNEDFGDHNSARISAAYLQSFTSGAELKYRFTYGTGFRAPSLSEIAYNSGPFALSPASDTVLVEESSEGFDIGFDFTAVNNFFLSMVYFKQTIEDEIFFDLVDFSGYLQSTDDSESSGFEIITEYPFNSQWSLEANLTLNDTETTGGVQRLRRPETLANINLSYTGADDKLNILAGVRIARDAVNEIFGVGRVALDDYEVFNVSATYNMADSVQLYARIENLTDEEYEEITGFNVAERAVYAGVRYRF